MGTDTDLGFGWLVDTWGEEEMERKRENGTGGMEMHSHSKRYHMLLTFYTSRPLFSSFHFSVLRDHFFFLRDPLLLRFIYYRWDFFGFCRG